jgi:predicted chitinase
MSLPAGNILLVKNALNKYGITNPYMVTAILATIAKESLFVPRNENMNYTSTSRLRAVFPSYFKTDADALPYVRNPEGLANRVYGNKYGNTSPNDGWKYRGRGFHGITFKSNYQRYGKMINQNIVTNPDVVNSPPIAAELAAVYYVDTLPRMAQKYGAKNINDWKDLDTALLAAINATAGAGASQYTINWNLEAAKKFIPQLQQFTPPREFLLLPVLFIAAGTYLLTR